jgi:hypothetical protein
MALSITFNNATLGVALTIKSHYAEYPFYIVMASVFML